MSDKQRRFILDTAILMLQNDGNELDCRRLITSMMTIANFSDAEITEVENAIAVSKQ